MERNVVLLSVNPLSANPKKWSNTLTQLVDKLLTNCLSVFDCFVALEVKGLRLIWLMILSSNAKTVLPTNFIETVS